MSSESNQNGEKSSFDRAHDAVNKIRSAGKNVKRVVRTVRTAQATAQALIGGFSITGWAIVAALIMVVASTFLISIIGGGGPVNAGTPPTINPPPIYGCGDDLDGILKSHNITATNVQTCERKAVIVNAVVKLFSYNDFALKYGSAPLEIENVIDPKRGCGTTENWIGCTGNGGHFSVRNIDNSHDPSYWTYIITHEMFHVLDDRSGIQKDYDYFSYLDSEASCYRPTDRGWVLNTYEVPPGDKISESFAESGAVYVTGRGGTGSFPDFESKCPNNYDFWNQEIGLPPTNGGGNTGDGNRTGPLVTFTVGNHTVTTHKSNASDCNGKYYGKKQIDLSNTIKFPIGNFGDPNCDFSNDAAINLIKALDPGTFTAKNGRVYQRYAVWDGVIHCESGYFPDAFRQNSRSGWGAWGLFQMNPDFSGRALHDNGTTDWRTQIQNAITRNNSHGGGFGYWGCSKGFRNGTEDPRI